MTKTPKLLNHVNPTNKIELMNTVNEAAHELFTDQDLVKELFSISKREQNYALNKMVAILNIF